MCKKIILDFGSLSDLSGKLYGRKLYHEQIKKNINWCEDLTVEFPSAVEAVSISFVQGIMAAYIDDIPSELKVQDKREYFKQHCRLVSNNEMIQESLVSSINF